MQIEIVAIGKRMPTWVDEAFNDYQGRLNRGLKVKIKALEASRRTATVGAERGRDEESSRLLAAVPPGARVICLDEHGKNWSTQQLSIQLAGWMQEGQSVSMLIGGADGMNRDCLQRAEKIWSLSALTLPHPLVRVVVIEQLYRAWSMLNNLPYHRA
ncbi:MAG: 23S rRNA (pseudouridine(1915)-N(3))-methyltransferase RlmH [Gammaproteobacteria bacterium]|nr:MAG: 23S rRNA (pseudouridine(1915)-N(3))-methyltransferase RlmH [Gammaproteobacteria bacterium]RLA14011.1 MAG: 23S rRNA (pseudouridine(1915)-N(3))-methyltransferase RlmH [Gammaproteobacteria bacterium]